MSGVESRHAHVTVRIGLELSVGGENYRLKSVTAHRDPRKRGRLYGKPTSRGSVRPHSSAVLMLVEHVT